MEKKVLIDLLTLQYIQGKAADSALEYVRLFRQAREEIKSAYKATEDRVNLDALSS